MLLCTLGNGRYVGGAYQCSPLSQNDDGLIEVCFFKPMSIFNFARLIGSYRDGSFINRSDVKDKMTYLRGKTIDIESPSAIDLCIDGEIVNGSRFRVELLPRAVRFITPRD
jgi:diacylglycerol kinase (ATP)